MQNETPAPPPPQPASYVQETAYTTDEPAANVGVQDEAHGDLLQFALEVFAVLPSFF